jgi:GcrA cell cycle regulator
MSWTLEREEKLRELWKKGYTASQIASLLSNTTRNAVIGKAHRLNLEARTVSKKPTSKVNVENNLKPEVKIQKHGRKARFKALLLDKSLSKKIQKNLKN